MFIHGSRFFSMSLSLISLVPAFSEGLSLMENKLMSWWSSNDWNSFRHGGSVRNFVCMIFSDVLILPHTSSYQYYTCLAQVYTPVLWGFPQTWCTFIMGKHGQVLMNTIPTLWLTVSPLTSRVSLCFVVWIVWQVLHMLLLEDFLGKCLHLSRPWITVIWALSPCLLCLTEHLHWK